MSLTQRVLCRRSEYVFTPAHRPCRAVPGGPAQVLRVRFHARAPAHHAQTMHFRDISGAFPGHFRGVSRAFPGRFRGISGTFPDAGFPNIIGHHAVQAARYAAEMRRKAYTNCKFARKIYKNPVLWQPFTPQTHRILLFLRIPQLRQTFTAPGTGRRPCPRSAPRSFPRAF